MHRIEEAVFSQLGVLTVNFGVLDRVVSFYAAQMLECKDPVIAQNIIYAFTFDRKLDTLRDIAEYKAHGNLKIDNSLARIKALIPRAKAASKHRNDLVHGILTLVEETGDFVTINRNRSRNLDAGEIEELARECFVLGIQFRSAITDFGRALEDADTEQGGSESQSQPE